MCATGLGYASGERYCTPPQCSNGVRAASVNGDRAPSRSVPPGHKAMGTMSGRRVSIALLWRIEEIISFHYLCTVSTLTCHHGNDRIPRGRSA